MESARVGDSFYGKDRILPLRIPLPVEHPAEYAGCPFAAGERVALLRGVTAMGRPKQRATLEFPSAGHFDGASEHAWVTAVN
jgi:hypothetical protein